MSAADGKLRISYCCCSGGGDDGDKVDLFPAAANTANTFERGEQTMTKQRGPKECLLASTCTYRENVRYNNVIDDRSYVESLSILLDYPTRFDCSLAYVVSVSVDALAF